MIAHASGLEPVSPSQRRTMLWPDGQANHIADFLVVSPAVLRYPDSVHLASCYGADHHAASKLPW